MAGQGGPGAGTDGLGKLACCAARYSTDVSPLWRHIGRLLNIRTWAMSAYKGIVEAGSNNEAAGRSTAQAMGRALVRSV